MTQPTHLKKKAIEVNYQGTNLLFRSDFDSGNLWKAELNEQTKQIILQAGRDRQNNPSVKNWFYFSIEGNYEELSLKLVLEKCNILTPVWKVQDVYRPVVRVQGEEWKRLETPVEFQTIESVLKMRFNLNLSNSKKIEVALIYPWTVKENQQYLNRAVEKGKANKSIYINKEVIVHSFQKRNVHLLAISSSEVQQSKTDQYIEGLFPERQNEEHYKYSDKPIILITSRVHPGEVGSSHSCNGIINYLVSNEEIAEKLRKQFMFWIIPILNPDGVFDGNNRMDALGQNLNRFYHLPDKQKQPSCFAVKSLVESCRKQLYAFFDLHGHANRKSCFLYGNSIPLARLQAESLLFAKVLSLRCEEIDFNNCNFTKKQMSSKDKSDELTKQGCARVVIHRWSGSPYCYTLQTGLHKNIRVDDKGIERYSEQFYTIQTYQNLGKQMLLSFNQILGKSKKIEDLRKQMIILTAKLQKLNTKATKSQKQLKSKKQIKEKDDDLIKDKTNEVTSKQLAETEEKEEKTQVSSHKSLSLEPDKSKQVEELLRKNKQYLIGLEEDEDLYD